MPTLTSSGYSDTWKNGLALKRFNFNLKSTLKETRNTSQLRRLNSDFFVNFPLYWKKSVNVLFQTEFFLESLESQWSIPVSEMRRWLVFFWVR